jgi:hypothetical protein
LSIRPSYQSLMSLFQQGVAADAGAAAKSRPTPARIAMRVSRFSVDLPGEDVRTRPRERA